PGQRGGPCRHPRQGPPSRPGYGRSQCTSSPILRLLRDRVAQVPQIPAQRRVRAGPTALDQLGGVEQPLPRLIVLAAQAAGRLSAHGRVSLLLWSEVSPLALTRRVRREPGG